MAATGSSPAPTRSGSPSPTSTARPDLVVADKGSNDVTILLNEPTADGGFTFVPGPRLNLKTATQQGIGPVATAIVPSPTGGPASLAVSVSGSNQVWLIPGVGGGFFNDQNPTIFSVGNQPRPAVRRQLRRQARPADRQLRVERPDADLRLHGLASGHHHHLLRRPRPGGGLRIQLRQRL